MKSIRRSLFMYKKHRALLCVCLLLLLSFLLLNYRSTYSQSGDRELTAAVLINSANRVGYYPNPMSGEMAGEFQRYLERYLEHLQIPYDIIDVNPQVTPTPLDLSDRQLIIAGHRGLGLSPDWQNAIASVVQGGTGFINLDSDPDIGSNAHMRAIFSATGSALGSPATRIVVPASVGPDGANPHFIAALQQHFLYDPPSDSPGDFTYNFHADGSGQINPVTATVLTDAQGTVIARLGADPLILASSYGSGRAVHFGTYDYLKADRFGFLMGIDDLFWRSAVWAARKPFVLRGYPRLWAVQIDDTLNDWGFRVRDLYSPALTGGNPWKVTGYLFYTNLIPGSNERASVISDIKAGLLQVSPHSATNENGGDFYFNRTQPYADAGWWDKVNEFLTWKQGSAPDGSDAIPSISRSMVPHWWDLGNNTGYDMWNTLGIRYVTIKQQPNFYLGDPAAADARRLKGARPFWLYEWPPTPAFATEDYPLFFADDYTVNGRDGQPSQTFFLFLTNVIDQVRYSKFRCNYFDDVRWPVPSYACADGITPDPPPNITKEESADMFKFSTWRLWSSMIPVNLFNHDSSGLSRATLEDRRFVISDVSAWLNSRKVEHVFMQDLGDYIYARNKSVLRRARYSGGNIAYQFTGSSATADGNLINTRLLVFTNEQPEGGYKIIPGFRNGLNITLPLPGPAPTITAVDPDNGPLAGGNSVTITGTGFLQDALTSLTIGGQAVSQFIINSPTSITATVPPGRALGAVDVVYANSNGSATLSSGYLYASPPSITRISPARGSAAGGTLLWIEGSSFVRGTTVTIGGVPATNVRIIDFNNLTAVAPPGALGAATVTVSTRNGQSTLPNGYVYIPPASILLQSTFNDGAASGWTGSPLGGALGWSVSSGRFVYNSTVHTQQYAGNAAWGNYDVEALVKLTSLANYPGGLRGRVDPATGQGYALWLYPASPDPRLILWKVSGWNIDAPRPVQLASARFTPDTNNFHKIKLSFRGPNITVYYDDVAVMNGSDSAYPYGVVALDVSNQRVQFDDILVTGPSLNSLTSSPSSITLSSFGDQQQLTVTGTYDGGSTVDMTSNPGTTYTSSNPAIVTVGSTGLVRAVGNGSTTITIRHGGVARIVPVSVNVVVLINRVSPTIVPASGGGLMMVHGANFTPSSRVTVGSTPVAGITFIDARTLTFTLPAGALGPASLRITNEVGSAARPNAFTYVDPDTIFFSDDFNTGSSDAWTASPLGRADGWSVVNGAFAYDGGGHTQQYAGDPTWTSYNLQVKFRLSSPYSYPGGIRGRVNPSTGVGYSVWLDPTSNQIRLYRTGGWNIDLPSSMLLGVASSVRFDTLNFHTLQISFVGASIQVFYDGSRIISATDSLGTSGLVALDVSNQRIEFDDVLVTVNP